MAELTRRTFLALAGAFGAAAFPTTATARSPRAVRPRTDWNPTVAWRGADLWGAH